MRRLHGASGRRAGALLRDAAVGGCGQEGDHAPRPRHPGETASAAAAYVEEQVPQCGYCINGWIMTAAAFLKKRPKATDAEIRDALAGLKCRCATHAAIMRAIKRAQTQMA